MEHNGWLLDLYTDPGQGVALWLLDEDGSRRRLRQPFPISFYAAGAPGRLRELWRYLQAQRIQVKLGREERSELGAAESLSVLSIQVQQAAEQPPLFTRLSRAFPELTFYDADLQITLRHAAVYGTFPLARCRVVADKAGLVQELSVLDSPWDLDPAVAPLRILSLEPDVDPFHAPPARLLVRCQQGCYRLSLQAERPLLVNLRAILLRHDPDLLLTAWGDTWLLPRLLQLSEKWGIPLPLNRDPDCPVAYHREHTYFTYGQIIYRGRQVHLFGRWHVDGHNALLFHDYGMEGVLELGRVTALPIQTVARVSPGSGISAMQMLTALRRGVLVPWHKQQAESPKTALDLLHADQGGLVYQPLIGLHSAVAEVDFISMYPSIMARFNVSPETVGTGRPTAELAPELEAIADTQRLGLIPQTLAPLLKKRVALKLSLPAMPAWDPRRNAYKARSSAHKWLLVTCFGYLGYRNARFGRIEAHEAVTAYGREALLRAKEAAEDLGFTVLHMYVDGLWIKKEGASQVGDFQPVLDEIVERTGLPISLDGIYRWVAFLPSRLNETVPVANRYFGVFQDGSLKVRGIEARRRDTPLFIAEAQMELLELLAQAPEAGALSARLPDAIRLLRRKLRALRRGRASLEALLVSQKLSRSLQEYRTPSPAAIAAAQLASAGKTVKPGQRVRFLYTFGKPGVHAWDLPEPPRREAINIPLYAELLVRAARTVLEPQGLDEKRLRLWLSSPAGVAAPAQMSFQPLKVSTSSFTSPPTG
jgi:DNA polymerase-2